MKIRETTNVTGVSAASPLPSMLEAEFQQGAGTVQTSCPPPPADGVWLRVSRGG